MSQTLTFNVSLTTINCGECGGTYAINERYREQKQQEGGTWNCPYCKCGWGYTECENARLKRLLADEQARLARERAAHDQAKASIRTKEAEIAKQKNSSARLKKRIKNGVCPCCTRSFTNLRRHMETKHPDYTKAPA